MSEEFFEPGRQSKLGVLLIFATNIFQLVRSFWVLGVYFIIQDNDSGTLLYIIPGLVLALLATLVYSFMYYVRFIFYIDREKEAFILEKGVFSSTVVNIPFSKIQQVNFKRNILQRIIGVYSVQIDTAGSGQEEAEIKALSRSKAERLAQLLMQFSSAETGRDSEERVETLEKEHRAPAWEFKLGLSGILKLGLTSNYLRGLALLVAFYFTLVEQLNFSEEFSIASDFSNITEIISEEHIRIENGLSSSLPNPFMMEVISTVLLFLGLFLIGMLITVGETFIKYYNLTLKKTDAGLQVEMGLRDNTRINVTARRVQVMKMITNPLQKRMDLHQLQISVASSEDSLSKKRIKIPGLPLETVKAVKNYLYFSASEMNSVLRPDKILLYRKISRRILPLVLAFILIRLGSVELSIWAILILSVIYLSAVIAYQYCYYRSLRLSVSSEFLYKYSGIWNRKMEIIEVYKLQAVSLSQPIWYKNRQLLNLTFHSSGGDISFKLIQKQQALELANYLLYKIEDSKKPWM